MKKKVSIILTSILVPVCIFWVSLILLLVPHGQSAWLCAQIHGGDTDGALRTIERMQDVNVYDVPLCLRRLMNAVERGCELPLVAACDEGNVEVVKALLRKGADPNQFLEGGWSPLEVNAERRHPQRLEIMQWLLEYGADVDAYGSYHSALFTELENARICADDWTAEEAALYKDSIEYLLQNGAAQTDERGDTVAHYLSAAGDVTFLKEIVTTYGLAIDEPNNDGETPLMWAAKCGHIEMMTYLLELGANPTATDNEGRTAKDYITKG